MIIKERKCEKREITDELMSNIGGRTEAAGRR